MISLFWNLLSCFFRGRAHSTLSILITLPWALEENVYFALLNLGLYKYQFGNFVSLHFYSWLMAPNSSPEQCWIEVGTYILVLFSLKKVYILSLGILSLDIIWPGLWSFSLFSHLLILSKYSSGIHNDLGKSFFK